MLFKEVLLVKVRIFSDFLVVGLLKLAMALWSWSRWDFLWQNRLFSKDQGSLFKIWVGLFKHQTLTFMVVEGLFRFQLKLFQNLDRTFWDEGTFSISRSIFTFFAQALFQDQGRIFYLFANLLKIEGPLHFLTRIFNFYAHQGFFKKDQEKAQDQDLATF